MNSMIFEMKQRTEPDQREMAVALDYEAQMQTAQQLGLLAQVEILKEKKTGAETRSQFEIAPLAPEEFLIWQKWASRQYTGDGVKGYNSDTIPSAVLNHWESCKKMGTFSSYRILTNHNPHNKQSGQESLLVAAAGEDTYLLARWTEPGIDLQSFTDIKRAMWKQCVRDATFTQNLLFLLAICMLAFIMIAHITQSIAIGLIVGAIAAGYGAIKIRDLILRDDGTARALIKYGCQGMYGYSPF